MELLGGVADLYEHHQDEGFEFADNGGGESISWVDADAEVPARAPSSDTDEDADASPSSSEEGSDDYSEDEELPDYACAYCGLHEPASAMVRCGVCDRWFCNARLGTASSHVATHMVISRHKEVVLHESSPLGAQAVECYMCGCRNIFMLGFVPAKEDNVVVVLCRDPCGFSSHAKDMSWDCDSWLPLLEQEGRSLLAWLVSVPDQRVQERYRSLPLAELREREQMWREQQQRLRQPTTTAKTAAAAALGGSAAGEEPPRAETPQVVLRYADAAAYCEVFGTLVQLEADYDRELRESQKFRVLVHWEERGSTGSGNRRWVARFELPRGDSEMRLAPGDELVLRHPETEWEQVGLVVHMFGAEDVTLELRAESGGGGEVPTHLQTGFEVDYLWKPTTFERMQEALRRLRTKDGCMSASLFHQLLGHDEAQVAPGAPALLRPPDGWRAPGLPPLNPPQEAALRRALEKDLTLIQGPPGTGKTVTSAALVHHLVRATGAPVLVCAPSNVAVDQLTERLHRTGLKVLRVCAKSREELASSVDFLSLHHVVDEAIARLGGELRQLHAAHVRGDALSARQMKRLRQLRLALEQRLLRGCQVVAATCSGAGDARVVGCSFGTVLIDEATQATEPEALIAMVRGARRVVMVGDHAQLPPVVMSKRAVKAGLAQSVFERLLALGHVPQRLTVQYRMHPCLSAFPSDMFYDGTLENGVTAEERRVDLVPFPWPSRDNPMFFYHCDGVEESSASGTSFLNRKEAAAVESMVTRLLRAGVKPASIGVITPYEGQRAYLVAYMQNLGSMPREAYDEVEIKSVDAFQGREKDVVLLTCVRSNQHQGIGFLRDPRRLNVAITRARLGLIIIGNALVLSRQNLWHHLLHHFVSMKLLVTGPLDALKRVEMKLSKPRSYRPERRFVSEGSKLIASASAYSGLDHASAFSNLSLSQNQSLSQPLSSLSSLSQEYLSEDLTQ